MADTRLPPAKGKPREELLRQVMPPPRRSRERSAEAAGELPADDLQHVIRGLVFAQRPIRAATADVTRRFGLAPQGSHILSLIDGGIAYPADLATTLRMSKASITKELARLVEAGLVVATQDEHDRRRTDLALSAAGKRVCTEARESTLALLRRNLATYSADEVRLFADMLRDVSQS